jgi:L-ascorbate peroxidase
LYYKETLDFAKSGNKPDGVFVFPSDEKLALHKDVGPAFAGFVDGQGKWTSKFSDA